MNLIWKIYYIGTQIKYITVEDFDLPYIVVTESQALEFVSGGKKETIKPGQIVIVPAFDDHGIKNAGSVNLVIASMTVIGD